MRISSGIALTQIMPGPNATNSTVHRAAPARRGWRGHRADGDAQRALHRRADRRHDLSYAAQSAGISGSDDRTAAAAVGILLRTSVTSAWLSARGVVLGIVMAAIFVAVGILKWPMLLVICVVAP